MEIVKKKKKSSEDNDKTCLSNELILNKCKFFEGKPFLIGNMFKNALV
jgi:hypothetical protein